jgi:hypothetical protein
MNHKKNNLFFEYLITKKKHASLEACLINELGIFYCLTTFVEVTTESLVVFTT